MMSTAQNQFPSPVGLEPLCNALAVVIRQRLGANKMSVNRLTELTGLSRQAFDSIEASRCPPTIDTLARISRAFGMPCSKLMVEAEIELRLGNFHRRGVRAGRGWLRHGLDNNRQSDTSAPTRNIPQPQR